VVKIQFRINNKHIPNMSHKFNNNLPKWVHHPLLPHKELCPKELYKILHKCKPFNNLLYHHPFNNNIFNNHHNHNKPQLVLD
jgi:hypothetical protein